MVDTLRVVICGDDGVGKSSLIAALIKEKFVPNIQRVIPPIDIPKDFSSSPYTANATVLVDTLASDITTLQDEIRKADVIWLVYADHYTYERIALYWIPMFRSMGVNLPVVLCNNKSDLSSPSESEMIMIDEMLPILQEFKEVEACVRCSAKENYNVNQAFYLCQRAVTHPIAPLYDYKENALKPLATKALARVFYLCDRDQDGYLNDEEFMNLQMKCFNKSIDINELTFIKKTLNDIIPFSVTSKGITEEGFLALNKIYAETGRHETIWSILRTFHYTDSLSIDDKVLFPKFDVPSNASVELSPSGYKFLVDLFILFDKDNDGGLSDSELNQLFYPTPGVPKLWTETNFPRSVVCNEQGYVTLQGWLAQWSMATYLDYKTTLAYFGYLGFEGKKSKNNKGNNGNTTSALYITKPRKLRKRNGKVYRAPVTDRTVFNAFILGASKSGKSSLIETFLGRQYSDVYSPTIQPNIAVNNVELKGGKQCYLILEELGELESAIVENQKRLEQCDVICYAYDSSDPESFQRLIELRRAHPQLDDLPAVYVALKADLDRQQQRCDLQPEPYTRALFLPAPLHISSSWSASIGELLVHLVEAAAAPSCATPLLGPEPKPEPLLTPVTVAGGAVAFMVVASLYVLRSQFRSLASSGSR